MTISRQCSGTSHSMVAGEFLLTPEAFRTISELLQSETGITLNDGKATLLYSRLGKRMRALGLQDFGQYCALLKQTDGAEERGRMMRALTTNVTRFFREAHHFTYLEDVVLPPLLRSAERGGRVRLWSAACSTGQEAYSIALTVLGLLPRAADLDIRILGTDIDTQVLKDATAGTYTADALTSVPANGLHRWFQRVEDDWQVGPELRRLTSFRALNLIKPFPMRGPFDTIFCRNVVIYFNEPQQQTIWSKFEPLLTSTGTLFVGHSERVAGPAAARFDSVGITIYQRRSPA